MNIQKEIKNVLNLICKKHGEKVSDYDVIDDDTVCLLDSNDVPIKTISVNELNQFWNISEDKRFSDDEEVDLYLLKRLNSTHSGTRELIRQPDWY